MGAWTHALQEFIVIPRYQEFLRNSKHPHVGFLGSPDLNSHLMGELSLTACSRPPACKHALPSLLVPNADTEGTAFGKDRIQINGIFRNSPTPPK